MKEYHKHSSYNFADISKFTYNVKSKKEMADDNVGVMLKWIGLKTELPG